MGGDTVVVVVVVELVVVEGAVSGGGVSVVDVDGDILGAFV
jgi:hypothetical protein